MAGLYHRMKNQRLVASDHQVMSQNNENQPDLSQLSSKQLAKAFKAAKRQERLHRAPLSETTSTS